MNYRAPLALLAVLLLAVLALPYFYKSSNKRAAPAPPPPPAPAPEAAPSPPPAPELWIPANIFDQKDIGLFPVLAGPLPAGPVCFNIQSYLRHSDEDLRQLYLQAKESGRGKESEADCRVEAAVPASCEPEEGKFAFDYLDGECVSVSTFCEPRTRFRRENYPERMYLRIFDDKESCQAGSRAG